LIVATLFVTGILALWASAALYVDGPPGFAPALCVAYALTTIAILIRIRPWPRAFLAAAGLFALVLVWWLSLAPSNDRDWMADVERPPTGEVVGDTLVLRNVRDFAYRSETDFTPRWEERRYDLSKLQGFDLFLVHWGSPYIAHTIASWDFGDDHLAVSIETRKEVGETYSAVLGFFRQYEIYYVAADERDVVGLRASQRGEDVRLYRLATPVETARATLLDYVEEMNRLAETPEWYNALTHNCTTTIRMHATHVGDTPRWDPRFLANGTLDEMGYERGSINTSMPFEELRRLSNVTARATEADGAPDFSARIRAGLPARPPPQIASAGEH
jgi:hypothetical protein